MGVQHPPIFITREDSSKSGSLHRPNQAIFKGLRIHNTFTICKNQYQNSVYQLSENLYFPNFSTVLTIVSLVVDSGYDKMSNTLFVNTALKVSGSLMKYTIFYKKAFFHSILKLS